MKAFLEDSRNQANEEVGEKGNDRGEPTNQWAEVQLQHFQRAFPTIRNQRAKRLSAQAIDQDCFIRAVQNDDNRKFIYQRILNMEKETFPSKSTCLQLYRNAYVRVVVDKCACVKQKHS